VCESRELWCGKQEQTGLVSRGEGVTATCHNPPPLIAHISTEDNRPIRKSELVKKYLKQVIHFANSIDYEKL
jgi:hypothetical protein